MIRFFCCFVYIGGENLDMGETSGSTEEEKPEQPSEGKQPRYNTCQHNSLKTKHVNITA